MLATLCYGAPGFCEVFLWGVFRNGMDLGYPRGERHYGGQILVVVFIRRLGYILRGDASFLGMNGD